MKSLLVNGLALFSLLAFVASVKADSANYYLGKDQIYKKAPNGLLVPLTSDELKVWNEQQTVEKEFEQIAATQDLMQLKTFNERVEKNWRTRDEDFYRHLSWEIAVALAVRPFPSSDRAAAYDLFAEKTLRLSEEGKLALGEENILLVSLSRLSYFWPKEKLNGQWAVRRTSSVEPWLRFDKRLIAQIDPNWGVGDLKNANMSAILSAEQISQLKGIEGAKVIEEARQEVAKRRKRNEEQQRLAALKTQWEKNFMAFLQSFYTKSPYNMPELLKVLEQSSLNQQQKQSVIGAVALTLQKTVEGVTQDPFAGLPQEAAQ